MSFGSSKKKQAKIFHEVSCPYGSASRHRDDKVIHTNPKGNDRELKHSGCPLNKAKCSKCN